MYLARQTEGLGIDYILVFTWQTQFIQIDDNVMIDLVHHLNLFILTADILRFGAGSAWKLFRYGVTSCCAKSSCSRLNDNQKVKIL